VRTPTKIVETAPPGIIGTSSPRLDRRDKVAGTFEYGADAIRPGMLWGRLRRSEIPHGIIRSIDISHAVALPGVRSVITGEDTVDFLASRLIRDEPIIAHERVRYHGEPVAAVAADTEEIAEEACRLITVEYQPLPIIHDTGEALADGAPLIHPNWESYWAAPLVRRNGNVMSHASLKRGDVASAFATAPHVFEDHYDVSMVHQVSLEGRVAIAEFDSDGNVHVWSSHQYPFGLRQDLADILHIPVGKIRVTITGVGGGFGGKLYAGVEPYCVLLSQRTRRPVKMRFTRDEEMIATSPRTGARVSLRTAVDETGRFLAREGVIHYDSGAYSASSPSIVSVGLLALPGPYRWKALSIDAMAVYTNKANCGSYRAPGAPQAVFAGESQIDKIARSLDIDPFDLRMMNAVEDGDLGPTGQVLNSVSLKETLKVAAEAIGWTEPRQHGRGKGLACSWWTTTGGASSAYIRLDEDGSFVLAVGGTEIGTGALTAGVAQICAGELGIDPEELQLISADTEVTPYDFGAQGSRTTVQIGNAVIKATADLKSQMFEVAAGELGIDPDRLELADKQIRSRDDPTLALELGEVARLGKSRGSLLGRGSHLQPPTAFDEAAVEGAVFGVFNTPSFGTHACEIEVDADTGEATLHRYVVVQDVGKVINPLYAKGQLSGGAVQGIGQALFEEISYRDGVVANPNLTDYKIPTIVDVPEVETILVEQPSPTGPYGAKGVGETGIIAPTACIANGIYDAVGVQVTRTPLTAQRIWEAMHSDT
jgi:CO/xanthine dehydrogenase Mo-binding subunit